MEKIFVYGSLMRGFHNHDKVLRHRIKHVERGTIQGNLYHLPAGYPAIVEGEKAIQGEVFTIRQDKIIKSLDLLEGYLGEGEDNLYERKKKKVKLADGAIEECWVYIYVNKDYAKHKGIAVEHGDWARYIMTKENKLG